MFSKPIAFGVLAAGCVIGAGGGAYLAVRQGTPPEQPAAVASLPPAVAETEALVTEPVVPTPLEPEPGIGELASPEPARPAARPAPDRQASRVAPPRVRPSENGGGIARRQEPPPAPPTVDDRGWTSPPPFEGSAPEPRQEPARYPLDPPPLPAREYVEIVVPSTAVIGLQVDTPLTTERARVEDRVQARVTRDVMADGRVAIPAGARVLGSVVLVERGGKVKERARLGVRFHTLVLADGTEVPLRTEPIYREGESPGADSARKIGGAAAGGAILGAIIGGGRGAAIGGAAGAAGGTAVVMAGDRHAATLPAGTVVTVRLTGPVTMEVERH